MFSEVSSCRSQILCLPPVSLVYATYLPLGVITAWTLPVSENLSDLNGADRIGADSVEAVFLFWANHAAMRSEPTTTTESAAKGKYDLCGAGSERSGPLLLDSSVTAK